MATFAIVVARFYEDLAQRLELLPELSVEAGHA